MKRVTILSDSSDGTAHHFAQYLKVNQCEHTHMYWDEFSDHPHRKIMELYDSLRLSGGVYIREPAAFDFYDLTLRDAVLELIPPCVSVIAPSRSSTNWSKPAHERTLRTFLERIGGTLFVPDSVVGTHIANDTNISFIRKNISSMPGAARRAGQLEPPSSDIAKQATLLPQLYQRELRGREYRVHVLDERAIAFELLRPEHRTAVDFPHPCPCKIGELPSGVVNTCIRITKYEGLRFAGIDIICDQQGDYWLLEVNPMPGYHAYEIRLIDHSRPVSELLLASLLTFNAQAAPSA